MQPRVTRHIQTLGILWFVYGAYRAVTGAFGALFLAGFIPRIGFGRWGMAGQGAWGLGHIPFAGALAGFVLASTVVSALLAFIAGYGLTTRSAWGRMLGIIAGALALFHPLSGTALGIYTLWVLAPYASRIEYDALSARV